MKNQGVDAAHAQAGSVLIWIFIMVALFGAFSIVMSQGTRTGQGMVTGDRARLAATDILENARSVKEAVKSVMIGNGCTETQISFENSVSSVSFTNPSAPATKKCHIFRPEGAALNYTRLPAQYFDGTNSAQTGYGYTVFTNGLQILNVGTTAVELLYHVNYLSKDVCTAINKILAVPNPSDAPPSETNTVSSYFLGTYGSPAADGLGDIPELSGKTAFCRYRPTAPANYQFSSVLLAR